MTTLGMPFFLADKTGSVFGSDFTDLYGRMSLRVTCTQRNNQRIAYMVYRLDDSSTYVNNVNRPQAALDFGPNHALGTVSIGPKPHIPMEQYLTKASMTGCVQLAITPDPPDAFPLPVRYPVNSLQPTVRFIGGPGGRPRPTSGRYAPPASTGGRIENNRSP